MSVYNKTNLKSHFKLPYLIDRTFGNKVLSSLLYVPDYIQQIQDNKNEFIGHTYYPIYYTNIQSKYYKILRPLGNIFNVKIMWYHSIYPGTTNDINTIRFYGNIDNVFMVNHIFTYIHTGLIILQTEITKEQRVERRKYRRKGKTWDKGNAIQFSSNIISNILHRTRCRLKEILEVAKKNQDKDQIALLNNYIKESCNLDYVDTYQNSTKVFKHLHFINL